MAADFLAKPGLSERQGFHMVHHVMPTLEDLINMDCNGITPIGI